MSDADVIEMLAQHLITKPVFEALFSDYSFAQHNPMSQAMQGVPASRTDRSFCPGSTAGRAGSAGQRDVIALHVSDHGGDDHISEAERNIVRRAATLIRLIARKRDRA